MKQRWQELFGAGFEVLAGNTADCTTLPEFLEWIEARYGCGERVWVIDRGIPTEAHLAEMRRRGAHYLVGTPKGHSSRLEGELATRLWEHARPEVKGKLLPQEDELYVFVESDQQLLLAKLGWTLPPQARRRSPLQI